MSNRQTSSGNGANMPRSAFAIIATGEGEDRKYLLQWNPKWEMFNLVGGKLDNSKGDNDSLMRTIQRELNEELGLKPEEEYLIVRELQQIELQQFSYRDQVTKNYLFSVFEVELFPRLPIDPRMRINAARWLSTGRENIFVSQSELNNLVTHSGWPISITARRILQEIGEIPKSAPPQKRPQSDPLSPEERAALTDAQKAAQETMQVQELIQRLAEMENALQVKKGPGGETAALVDVNLLKQTRRALQESEARYRRLVTRMPIVVCELMADGTTLFVNSAITKATGYLPEELQGQNWWQILSPHDRAQVKELRRHCQRGDVSDFELRLQSKDKSELSMIWYSTSTFDANGRLEKITGYGTNISKRKQVETELRKKETLFRLALDNIPDIVLILDANQRMQFINAQGNYFGRLTEEIYLGETLANIFPSYLVEKYAPLLTEAYRTGETQTGEFEVPLSKRTISLEVSVIPTLNEAGTVQQVLVLTEDVTRRRRMEEQLRRSEKAQRQAAQLQREILNTIPAHVALIDGEGVILAVNDTWRQFARDSGVENDNFGVNVNYLKVCRRGAASDLPGRDDARRAGDGIQAVLAGEKPMYTQEYACPTPSELYWFQLMVAPLKNSVRKAAVVLHIDITEHVKTKASLQASADRFEKTFHASPTANSITNLRTSKLIDLNESFAKMFGYSRDEIVGQTSADLGFWANREDREMITRLLDRGQTIRSYAGQARTKSGKILDVLASFEIIQLDGAPCVLSSLVDITEIKQNEFRIQVFSELGQRLSVARTVEEAAEIIVEVADDLLDWDACSLDLYAPETDTLTRVVGTDTVDGRRQKVPALSQRPPGPVPRRILEQGAEMLRADGADGASDDLGLFGDAERPLASLLLAPIRNGSQAAGLLAVKSYRTDAFDESDLTTLQALADYCGGALARIQVGAALQESQAGYQLLADTIEDIVSLHDLDGRFIYVSPSLTRVLGYSIEEALGKDGFSVMHPDDKERVRRQMEREITTGEGATSLWRCRAKVGHYVWLETKTAVIFDEQGQPTQFLRSSRDVTKRVQREKELEAMVTVSGALRSASTKEEMLSLVVGQMKQLLQTDGALLILHDETADQYRVEIASGCWKSIASRQIKPGQGISGHVIVTGDSYITKDVGQDPRLLWADLLQDSVYAAVCQPLMVGKQVTGVLWAVRKTEFVTSEIRVLEVLSAIAANAIYRVRLHEKLQTQARQLQQVMDAVPEGLILLDPDYQPLLVNPIARQYLEWLAPELGEGPMSQLGGVPLPRLLTAPADGRSYRELSIETPREAIFRLDASPIQAGDIDGGWVLVLQEVTEERRQQVRSQQRERLAAVGQLAAGIAHDFNNIMGVIILYAQLLQNATDLSEKDRHRLNVIYKQAEHAAELIHQILDFSRRSVLERSPVDLLPFLKELCRLWRRTFPENIDIRLIQDEGHFVINADPTRIQQMLMNLAVNARDAMPQGGQLHFHLDIYTLTEKQKPPLSEMTPGNWVRLAVTDSGAGIPADAIPHIFEPFYSTKDTTQGTGLGLAQVYGIVKQHDGHILVESQLGEGTTFKVYLPQVMQSVPEPTASEEKAVAGQQAAGRILLVEDDAALRETIEDILTALGFKVVVAPNGRIAMTLYSQPQEQFDLVLSDLIMPELDGMSLYEQLRQQDSDVKMIVMTGYPLEDEGKELLEQGIVTWIQKPFLAEDISKKIELALKGD